MGGARLSFGGVGRKRFGCWSPTWVFVVQVVHVGDEAVVRQEKPNPGQQHGEIDPVVSVLWLGVFRNCPKREGRRGDVTVTPELHVPCGTGGVEAQRVSLGASQPQPCSAPNALSLEKLLPEIKAGGQENTGALRVDVLFFSSRGRAGQERAAENPPS